MILFCPFIVHIQSWFYIHILLKQSEVWERDSSHCNGCHGCASSTVDHFICASWSLCCFHVSFHQGIMLTCWLKLKLCIFWFKLKICNSVPQEKFPRKPYNNFFASLRTLASSRSIKHAKKQKNLDNIQPSWPHAWSF